MSDGVLDRHRAAPDGLELTWETADAEALPYDDAAFGVVLSAIGVMFAPHHQQAADELVRAGRPGGKVEALNADLADLADLAARGKGSSATGSWAGSTCS